MQRTTCPSREEWIRFDRGLVDDARQREMADHLDVCEFCAQSIENLDGYREAILAPFEDCQPSDLVVDNDLRQMMERAIAQVQHDEPAEDADRLKGPEHLVRPPSSDAGETDSPHVPGYQLHKPIGHGGMGTVYRAWDEQFERDVAIKLLAAHAPHDRSAVSRFLFEAKITGQLQHPGIPSAHELGKLPDGRPFLVMKLVHGRTLNELLASRPDPFHERGRFLAIFEQICHTVGYAHAHGVIHRDLKPSNVMVGAFGEVQVMDWGLAKMLRSQPDHGAAEASDANEFRRITAADGIDTTSRRSDATCTGSILGTPSFMPPEQAGGDIRQLDQRSDVFGLGGILCVILTGRAPYSARSSTEAQQQAIRGELEAAFRELDACGAEPELVTLCKACLAIHQTDRPPDAGAVAAAVGRIREAAEERARRAVLERAEHRVRETESRQRRLILWFGAGVVALALVLGMVGTTIGLIRANAAADAQRQATELAEQQKGVAEKATEQTKRRLEQIEKGVLIIASLLTDINPRKEQKDGPPLYEILAQRASKAADELTVDSIGDPSVVARLQTVMGNTLRGLGESPKAIPILENALATLKAELGVDHAHTLSTQIILALAYQDQDRLNEAIRLLEDVSVARDNILGPKHPDTLAVNHNLASAYLSSGKLQKAIELMESVRDIEIESLGADHPNTIRTQSNLVAAYHSIGKLQQAIDLCEKVKEAEFRTLGPEHADALSTLYNLSWLYRAVGRRSEAVKTLEEVERVQSQKLGNDHPDTLSSRKALATMYVDAGKPAQAITLLERIVAAQQNRWGDNHQQTVAAIFELANAHREVGQTSQAIDLLKKCHEISQRTLGQDHPNTLNVGNSLGQAHLATGNLTEAISMLESVKEIQARVIGADHPDALATKHNLALAYKRSNKLPEAIKLNEEIRDAKIRVLGENHPDTLTTLNNLAQAYKAANEFDRAIPLFEKVLEKRAQVLGKEHPYTLTTHQSLALAYQDSGKLNLALPHFEAAALGIEKQLPHDQAKYILPDTITAYEEAGDLDKAESWMRKWFEIVKGTHGIGSREYAGCLYWMCTLLVKQEKWIESETLLRECVTEFEKSKPDTWPLFDAWSMLGASLSGQKKFAEASDFLRRGYDGLQRDAEKIPPVIRKQRLAAALDRLIVLSKAENNREAADKWQAQRDQLDLADSAKSADLDSKAAPPVSSN